MTQKYTTEKVDERLQKLQNQENISKRNKELFSKFLHRLRAEDNTQPSTNYKYVYTFEAIFQKFIDFPLDEATYDKMSVAVGKINSCDMSEWTKGDYKKALSKYYSTMYDSIQLDKEENEDIKRVVESGLLDKKSNIKREKEIEALTPEDVMSMVEEAQNPRDRLLPLFMFETGARISELLDIQLKDVNLTQKYADVVVPTRKNNKEPRSLTLTKSIGLLQDWMEKHPRRDTPEAPLLVNIADKKYSNKVNKEDDLNYKGKQMTSTNVQAVLRKLAEKAELDKYITNHVMRHSSASYLGRQFGLETMLYWFGWESPETAKTYLHHDKDQVRKQVLNKAGINKEENKDKLENQVCPRCEEKQPPTAKYCPQCSMSLDQEAAQRVKQLEKAGENLARERINGLDEDKIKRMLS